MNEIVGILSGALGILAVAAGFAAWLFHKRVEQRYHDLALSWTNEGDIHGKERIFVDLNLEYKHGTLSGTLTVNRSNETFEAFVRCGPFRTRMRIGLFKSRSLFPIALVALSLKSHPKLLQWKMITSDDPSLLPERTVLWPTELTAAEQGAAANP